MPFANRLEAGQKLAAVLHKKYASQKVVIYALPRGGVVLGAEIARALKAPLDLVIPRKIGHPHMEEYAICALSDGGELVCNEQEVAGVEKAWFEQAVAKEKREAQRRREKYLGNRKRVDAKNKIAIIVDDGVATGLTIKAAIKDVKKRAPKKVVVAVPVAPRDSVEDISTQVDEMICLEKPLLFMGAIGAYYREFDQVEDQEVIELMKD